MQPSRGGLEVERWSDNRTDSASVGSNPALGMLCRSSSNRKVMLQIPNCRAPGRKVYDIGPRVLAVKTVEIAKTKRQATNPSSECDSLEKREERAEMKI